MNDLRASALIEQSFWHFECYLGEIMLKGFWGGGEGMSVWYTIDRWKSPPPPQKKKKKKKKKKKPKNNKQQQQNKHTYTHTHTHTYKNTCYVP